MKLHIFIIGCLGILISTLVRADPILCPKDTGEFQKTGKHAGDITYTTIDDHSTKIQKNLTSHPCYDYQNNDFTKDTYYFTFHHFYLIFDVMKKNPQNTPKCNNDLIVLRDILKGYKKKYECEGQNYENYKKGNIATTLKKDDWTDEDRCIALLKLGEENDGECHYRHCEVGFGHND